MLLSLILFVTALFGHFLLGLAVYNWCYGAIVSEHRSTVIRGFLTVFLAGSPVGFWRLYGFDPLLPMEQALTSWPEALLSVYLIICWAAVLIVLPIITVARNLRRPPMAFVSNHTRHHDIAAEIGTRPIGRNKRRHYAHLPGNELFQLELNEKTLRLPRLPAAWEGLTILHLSDLHLCGTPDRVYFDKVMDHCRAWEPDLVAITGDIVDSANHHRWILPVLRRLKYKIAAFAILGNHDYRFDVAKIRRRLRRVGMRVLANTWETLDVRGQPLTVIGHEGPWLEPMPDLTSCPTEPFRLCLSHTPDQIAWARRHRMDLMLSGHVHGGQIRLPMFGSVFVPSRYGRRYDCGLFEEPPTVLHVSRGIGGKHPVRYNCRPEATLLRLTVKRTALPG